MIARGLSRRSSSVLPTPVEPIAIAATSLLAVVAGAAIAHSQAELAFLPAGFVLVWLCARHPVPAYLAVVVAASSFAYVGAWPSLTFHTTRISLAEAVLALALLGRVVAQFSVGTSRPRLEGLLLGIFLVAVLIGVAVGSYRGAGWHGALIAARAMLFYTVFWLALPLLADLKTRSVVLACLGVIAVFVVALQVLQISVGSSHHLFLAGSTSDQVINLQSEASGSFLRVRPPGITLVYVACAFSAAYLCWGPPRRRLRAAALLFVTFVGIAISLNRNMLLGLALGILLALVTTPGTTRALTILASVVVIAFVAGMLVRSNGGAGNALVDRVVSIGNWSQLNTSTLRDRYYENHQAWQQLAANPINGIGWGTSYGATLSTADGVVTRPFIHNQYLGAWLRTGLLGLLAIGGALIVSLRGGIMWSRTSVADVWLGAGVITSLVAVAVSSIVGIYMMNADAIVPLVTVLALAAALRSQLQRGS